MRNKKHLQLEEALEELGKPLKPIKLKYRNMLVQCDNLDCDVRGVRNRCYQLAKTFQCNKYRNDIAESEFFGRRE